MADTEPEVGSLINLQGFGLSDDFDGTTTDLQLAENVPVVNDDEAKGRLVENASWEQLFCTNSPGTAICGGDDGSPATQVGTDGVLRLVGIGSFSLGRCGNGPSCFTSIEFARKWLDEQ